MRMLSPGASIPITTLNQHVPSNFKRPYANYPPSIWGDTFLQFDSEPLEVDDNMKQQAQIYKEEVKKMFLSLSNDISQKLNLIDSIQRLGISYHFEHEIDEALEQIYNDFTKNKVRTKEEGDLHYLALLFRLLRQKGYHISSDIFEKFTINEGKFNEIISKDVEGMWSMYEAAQLRGHGEAILEEAHDFTYTNLKSMMSNNQLMSPSLAAQINQSLRQPLHKEIPRIGARRYISFYEKDPSHSKVLLTFAKLDFNMLQKLHQKEAGIMTKWWKNLDTATKAPYARERAVETHFLSLSLVSEPKFSNARRIGAKMIACISLLDDTYDAFGTFEELELFTEAIKRWDTSLLKSLPECMKVVYNAIIGLWDEIEWVTAKNGKSSLVLQYVKQAFSNLAEAYMVEAKWLHEDYIPTYDEYKINGIVSSTCAVLMTTFLGCVEESATKEVFDWIINCPTLLKVAAIFGRLKEDMGSHKCEQQRVHVASGVECCMKQYDISQEEAYKLICKETEDLWKDRNEACLTSNDVPKPVLDFVLNWARVAEFMYSNFEDKYSNGDLLKDYVVALLLDPTLI